jgi:hypothetical protein
MDIGLRTFIRASAAALLGVGAISFASAALACGDNALAHPVSWQGQQGSANPASLLHRAALTDFLGQPIVGMWSFKMTAGTATVDYGYVQWHSDGTEIENSAGRAPATENFCLGVWHPTGIRKYHLAHYALSYDSSGTLNAKVLIREDVTVNLSGTSYTGPFTLDVYDPNSNTLLQHVAGQVTGQRVAAN